MGQENDFVAVIEAEVEADPHNLILREDFITSLRAHRAKHSMR